MRLLYQNKENPYYGDDVVRRDKFEWIVNEIKAILFPEHKKHEAKEEDESTEKYEKEDDSENEGTKNAIVME